MHINKKAFTLIELLVVVLIIGILAAIALPQYNLALEKSRTATALSAMKALKESQERYFLTNGTYGERQNLDVTVEDTKYFQFRTGNLNTPTEAYKIYGLRRYKADPAFLELYADGSNKRLCKPQDSNDMKICEWLGCKNPEINKWCYLN